jgi:hypothetical protein
VKNKKAEPDRSSAFFAGAGRAFHVRAAGRAASVGDGLPEEEHDRQSHDCDVHGMLLGTEGRGPLYDSSSGRRAEICPRGSFFRAAGGSRYRRNENFYGERKPGHCDSATGRQTADKKAQVSRCLCLF